VALKEKRDLTCKKYEAHHRFAPLTKKTEAKKSGDDSQKILVQTCGNRTNQSQSCTGAIADSEKRHHEQLPERPREP